jgi:hypothetical protein
VNFYRKTREKQLLKSNLTSGIVLFPSKESGLAMASLGIIENELKGT